MVVVFFGDSTIRGQYELALKAKTFAEPLLYLGNTGGSSHHHLFPSQCELHKRWASLKLSSSSPISLLYTNFGVTHVLHVHPARPWWSYGAGRDCTGNTINSIYRQWNWSQGETGWVSDYLGFAQLEALVTRGVREAGRLARQVVVMLPNWVCNAKYNGDYAKYVVGGELYEDGLHACSQHLAERREHAKWPQLPSLSAFHNLSYAFADGRSLRRTGTQEGGHQHTRMTNNTESEDMAWCRIGQLSGQGSIALEARVRAAVVEADAQVRFVEATRLTVHRCNDSLDGRHYSQHILTRQLGNLLSLIDPAIINRTAASAEMMDAARSAMADMMVGG